MDVALTQGETDGKTLNGAHEITLIISIRKIRKNEVLATESNGLGEKLSNRAPEGEEKKKTKGASEGGKLVNVA